MNELLKRIPGENEEEYLWRVGQARDNGLIDEDWNEIADYMNEEFRDDVNDYRGESAYRKPYSYAKKFFDSGVFGSKESNNNKEDIDNIVAAERSLKISLQKLRDERTDYQRTIREQARYESLVDLIKRVMTETVEPKQFFSDYTEDYTQRVSEDELVICLSDLHKGIRVDNAWNKYDESILKKRLSSYLSQIIDIRNEHGIKTAYLILGGDNISGLIHTNLRLENNENVVRQLRSVSLIICNFVESLRAYFDLIEVYSISGNHSRVNADKKNNQRGENLDSLIPFHMSLYFKNDDKVAINENKLDETIGFFQTKSGKTIAYVHGDYDSPENVLQKLTMVLRVQPDIVVMGHRHHNSFESKFGSKIIQVGSVMGTDDYCIDHRIVGEPEQVAFVINPQQTVKCFYDVNLKN